MYRQHTIQKLLSNNFIGDKNSILNDSSVSNLQQILFNHKIIMKGLHEYLQSKLLKI